VSVVIGRVENAALHLELWLMSCRVLKRGMEDAMLDQVVKEALKLGVLEVFGYYHPTVKNAMVRDFYGLMGFERTRLDDEGNSVWRLALDAYALRNKHIRLVGVGGIE
jgi:predicted enzyme involved in methoxymalonyl-ACP biosynthesis